MSGDPVSPVGVSSTSGHYPRQKVAINRFRIGQGKIILKMA